MIPLHRPIPKPRWSALLVTTLVFGCTEYEPFTILPYNPDSPTDDWCSIDSGELVAAAPKDGIPSLSDPTVVQSDHPDAAYVPDDDRVLGIRAGVDAIAVPLNILRYHEIVNMHIAGIPMAITHCPLTGSSLAFVRPFEQADFGVSGLLYRNNLVMYDRSGQTEESMWPQMLRGARCGPRDGTDLVMHPVVETTWSAWVEMHPDTWVISEETGFERRYNVHPYGDYDTNDEVAWPYQPDPSRHIKERTLGVLDDTGGILYPFGALEDLGTVAAVQHDRATSAPGGAVILWDSGKQAAMAYSRTVDDTELTFTVMDDQIVDAETGSTWRVDGVATSGPMAGTVLDPIPEAYIAFWFAWSAFEPNATLWGES
jgi:hypothetical protein